MLHTAIVRLKSTRGLRSVVGAVVGIVATVAMGALPASAGGGPEPANCVIRLDRSVTTSSPGLVAFVPEGVAVASGGTITRYNAQLLPTGSRNVGQQIHRLESADHRVVYRVDSTILPFPYSFRLIGFDGSAPITLGNGASNDNVGIGVGGYTSWISGGNTGVGTLADVDQVVVGNFGFSLAGTFRSVLWTRAGDLLQPGAVTLHHFAAGSRDATSLGAVRPLPSGHLVAQADSSVKIISGLTLADLESFSLDAQIDAADYREGFGGVFLTKQGDLYRLSDGTLSLVATGIPSTHSGVAISKIAIDASGAIYLDSFGLVRRLDLGLVPHLSETALPDQVRRLYAAYFLRSPEASEVAFWAGRRAQGASLNSVSDFFAQSEEFRTRYGQLSNAGFVEQIYLNVLGRSPDAGGANHWLSQLNAGMSRGSVMVSFSESAEYLDLTGTTAAHPATYGQVHRLYRAYLDRAPERAGFCYWSQRYLDGTPLADVSQFFATSAEFTAKYGSLSDGQFVQQVYGNVLGRAPDGAGLTYWTDQLSRGMTRGRLMIGFSESPEFIARVGVAP